MVQKKSSSDNGYKENKPSKNKSEDVHSTTPNKKSTIIFAIFLLALVLFGFYTYYWLSSPQGQRTLTEVKEFILKYNPISWYLRLLEESQYAATNVWSTSSNTSSKMQGLILKRFEPLSSKEFPQGSPISLQYELELKNTYFENVPVKMYCSIKGEELKGGQESGVKILPDNEIILTGNRIYEEIRCLISSDITKSLEGPITFVGGASFPYQTKNVRLPVYFITANMNKELDGDDFFRYFSISEKQPIKAMYQGEPLEVAIGVSNNNQQPIIIGENRHPLIGITLRNRWNGYISELKDLKLIVPKQMNINKELSQNPNEICPFVLSRTGERLNEYRIDANIKEKIKLKSGALKTFECWFDVTEDLVSSNAYYTKEYYQVDAEYVYNLDNKTTTVSIRPIKAQNETIGGALS